VSRAPRLADVAAGRDNNVQALRLAAAVAVIVFHCFALTDHWTAEPLYRVFPETNLGLLGVQVFFALSGFLVTQSFVAHPTLRAFASARILRIYPALVAATLFTVIVAGASSTLAWRDYAVHPQTWRFLWRTATGYDVTDGLPGVFLGNPFPRAANGSLWTLPVELRLYVAVALAGIAGLLSRSLALAALTALACAAFAIFPWPLPFAPDNAIVRGLAVTFALGALAFVARAAIPLSPLAALAAVALFVANPGGAFRTWLLPPLLVYVVLVIAYHPRLRVRALNRTGDYSYGLYVYAFPVQQTLVRNLAGIEPAWLFALTVPITGILAAMSWHWLEQPALALKSRFRDPRGLPP
jgi:peptidoglycan/LPS O-acetylase OafA/YrhL